MEYEIVSSLTAQDYKERLADRWRRSGYIFFRPQCNSCNACEPIRTIVEDFCPNRSQRRVLKANETVTSFKIVTPQLTEEHIDLYDRHHRHHANQKNWPKPHRERIIEHLRMLSEKSYPTEEWDFFHAEKLVAVCYVDVIADGLSGIYFYHDPDLRNLSLGTWMCLSMIERARTLALPYIYLGYLVRGCRSMEYKANFQPYEILGLDGIWRRVVQK
jgi:arginine-tRNA-protein transferase